MQVKFKEAHGYVSFNHTPLFKPVLIICAYYVAFTDYSMTEGYMTTLLQYLVLCGSFGARCLSLVVNMSDLYLRNSLFSRAVFKQTCPIGTKI